MKTQTSQKLRLPIKAVTVAQPFKKAKPNNMQLHLSPFKRGWLFSTLVKLKFNVALIGLF